MENEIEDNLVTPAKYAKLCGVSRQAIMDRIGSGRLVTMQIAKAKRVYHLIDIKVFPPIRYRSPRDGK